MIPSLLIANRGEIARRVIRTAKRLGVRTIAVHSDVDSGMLFVREADEAISIGGAAARDSYLDQAKILVAAKTAGAAAIHPGYGFLSENADFAQKVIEAGLIWVGAPPAAIRAMGLKDAAKKLMMQAGVPVTPGYLGEDQSSKRLETEAATIGFPVLIKAVAGGGGKGMRKVDCARQFKDALESCKREAASSFGDDRVLLEKYIEQPRHIEVQVFGDTHGNIVHLFERDCSLQRRHQKVIEEAPAPGMSAEVRAALCATAVKAAQAVNYVGAGTVEFIADSSDGLRADRIWFMEMNTRLQVEHPVTEAITGEDLVEWQLRVASGEALPKRQDDLRIDGWAIEARLYAENPSAGFLPSTGPLKRLRLPSDVRIDSGFEEGDDVSEYYDPMIAKLIAHGASRTEAAERLAQACSAVQIWPVKTNAAFLARAAADPDFVAGDVDTGFIERNTPRLIPPLEPTSEVIAAAGRALAKDDPQTPWGALSGLRVGAASETRLWVELGGAPYQTETSQDAVDAQAAWVDGDQILFVHGEAWTFGAPKAGGGAKAAGADGRIFAPMSGRIAAVKIKAGDAVKAGQTLLALEAMKMEHNLIAPFDGEVSDLRAAVDQQATEGALLACVRKTASN